MTDPKTPPSKLDIARLEPFHGLGLDRIVVVKDERTAATALGVLMAAGEVGFDTESKPTFFKGQKSEGPHVLQFSTTDRAFIFQSHVEASHPAIMELLKSKSSLRSASAWVAISIRFPNASASVPVPSSISTVRSDRSAIGIPSGRSRRSRSISTASSRSRNLSPPRTGRRSSFPTVN